MIEVAPPAAASTGAETRSADAPAETVQAAPPAARRHAARNPARAETVAPGEIVVHKGDDRTTVRKAFGRPASSYTIGSEETWVYSDFPPRRVTFGSGRVESWEDMPVEP